MATPSTVVEASGLRKYYGSQLALDGVGLEVSAGEVVGLLGPNGAGKTTTLAILATLLRPDAGEIRIIGGAADSPARLVRGRLGYVPQAIALYPSLSARQNLTLFARIHGLSRCAAEVAVTHALDQVGLADRSADPVATLSGGMQRRLNLACGMVHRPALLLLDEPTVGVDPQSRERILVTVHDAAAAGAAVIYSTHYMEEVERICARAVLIDQGKVVAHGSIAELIALGRRHPRMELAFARPAPPGWTDGLADVKPIEAVGAGCVAFELASLSQVNAILERAHAAGANVLEFSVHSPNLSDAFISLTGHALRDPAAETH
jgi:ABC-2 type transport system ATP-binding protein